MQENTGCDTLVKALQSSGFTERHRHSLNIAKYFYASLQPVKSPHKCKMQVGTFHTTLKGDFMILKLYAHLEALSVLNAVHSKQIKACFFLATVRCDIHFGLARS